MSLSRRLLSEALGTAALLAIVVGSGIMGAKLADGNIAVALLANSLATGFGLFVLISVFAPLSGAHFNPVVSGMALRQGAIEHRVFISYVLVQLVAAVLGVWLAHAMFGVPVLDVGTQQRSGLGQWTSEVVATAGLLLVIRGTANRPTEFVAAAVGAYIAAAYWFTASTSFANPAVTIARSLTSTFAGIRPFDVLGFIAAQIIGAVVAYAIADYLWPQLRPVAAADESAEPTPESDSPQQHASSI
jgi:glycerol uptake facilitator-like aquaporin